MAHGEHYSAWKQTVCVVVAVEGVVQNWEIGPNDGLKLIPISKTIVLRRSIGDTTGKGF